MYKGKAKRISNPLTSMPDTPPPESESTFACACYKEVRTACYGDPSYQTLQGDRYCVLHFPSKEKSAEFKIALMKKVENKDFNFRGVWFPDPALFAGSEFKGEADFFAATFSAEADFRSATFSAAYFSNTTFSSVANFRYATFTAEADFSYATFSAEADFRYAIFGAKANFLHVTFGDQVRFLGDKTHPVFTEKSSLDLRFAIIEKPDHVSFHTLSLHPHWFANLDVRRFDFTDVEWKLRGIREEIVSLRAASVLAAHRSLATTYQQLASNAKENNRNEEASRFRYLMMDVARTERWFGFTFWKLEWWYWAASGYGRRTTQAFMVLVFIWLSCAFLYTRVGFTKIDPMLTSQTGTELQYSERGEPLSKSRALTYSLGVMALQKPEPKPITGAAQTIVLVETILGPLQAALFALAVRRKFQADLSQD